MGGGSRTRRARLAVPASLLLMVLLVLGGCTKGPGGPDSGEPEALTGVDRHPRHSSLEGLVFVREGAIWAVENGEARLVIESDSPWSLRNSRSGEAITYASLTGAHARVYSALRGDWRTDVIWETGLGSLLAEVVHDDVADALWFSASGEHTVTIGIRDRAGGEQEHAMVLPVEVGPSFTVSFDEPSLFLIGAAQEPAVLYAVDGEVRSLFEASRLFTPRLSPDARHLLVAGTQGGAAFRLWVIAVGSGEAAEIDTGPGVPVDAVWSRDGTRIAFRDTETGTVWIAPYPTGQASDTGLVADEGGLCW